jgi:hypothetical protein
MSPSMLASLNMDVLDVMKDKHIFFTASINKEHKRHVFEVLKSYCNTGKQIAIMEADGCIWSLSQTDKSYHFIATNAFQMKRPQPQVVSQPIFSVSDIKHLNCLSLRALHWIAAGYDLPPNANEQSVVESIVLKANGHVVAQSEETMANQRAIQVQQEMDNPASAVSTSSSQSVVQSGSRKRVYTQHELNSMKVPQLAEISKSRNIKRARTKQDMIQSILADQNVSNDEVNRLRHQLEHAATTGNTAPHDHYRSTFNAVDLHDRLWYKLQHNQPIRSWRTKLTISILEASVVNAFVLHRHFNTKSFVDFSQQLGIVLCSEHLRLI